MKKSKTRIFIDQIISANLIIYIKKKQHHFLKNVLRIKIDDEINIFDGKTGEWRAIVSSIRVIENQQGQTNNIKPIGLSNLISSKNNFNFFGIILSNIIKKW